MDSKRRIALLAVALALGAAACAPVGGVPPSTTIAGGESTSGTVAGVGGYPGEAVVGLGTVGSPRTLNPLLDGPDTAVLDLLAPAVFATGWYADGVIGELMPNLLAEIPTLENGGLVERGNGQMDVTVRLVDEAMWADGRPMTAADLLFTYETIVDDDNPVRSDVRTRYDLIVPGTVAADGQVLKFRMETSPEVARLFDIILPKHEVENGDFATDWVDTMWVSGGPFEFASWQPGQYLELRRNPRYWKVDAAGEALPRLDRLVVRFFEPGPTVDPRLHQSFRAKDLDLAIIPDAQDNLAEYETPREAAVVTMAVPGPGWDALVFQFGLANRNPESLNEHLAFRRAVAHSIDRSALAGQRGTLPIFSAVRPYRPSLAEDPWSQYEFDQELAAALLFELGEDLGVDQFSGDGPRLVLTTSAASPATVAVSGEVVVMLDEAGIAAELQLEDAALFFGSTLDTGTWDLATFRFTAGAGQAAVVDFLRLFDPDGIPFVGSNFARWGTEGSLVQDEATARYSQLMRSLENTVDAAEIDGLIRRAERLLAEQAVVIPLMVHEEIGAAWWAEAITGIDIDPVSGPFWNAAEWRDPLE